jgi:hypothetical protein
MGFTFETTEHRPCLLGMPWFQQNLAFVDHDGVTSHDHRALGGDSLGFRSGHPLDICSRHFIGAPRLIDVSRYYFKLEADRFE